MALLLKKQNRIYLLTEIPKMRKKNKKLNYIKIELFFLRFKWRIVKYKPTLPKDVKISFIFHMLLLKLSYRKLPI